MDHNTCDVCGRQGLYAWTTIQTMCVVGLQAEAVCMDNSTCDVCGRQGLYVWTTV